MGLIVLVLLYGGMMASELGRGTLTHLLTKGSLPWRRNSGQVRCGSVGVDGLRTRCCLGVTWVYTLYFWPTDSLPNLLLAALGLWGVSDWYCSRPCRWAVCCSKATMAACSSPAHWSYC